MAYVRTRGNQLCIVRGERNPETGKVEQQILFTVYSQAEARAILGRGESLHDTDRFQRLLESEHLQIRFDWKAIKRSIEREMSMLPETYDPRGARVVDGFRRDLLAFARQLAMADPQSLLPMAEVIAEHRHELDVLVDLIRWRTKLCDQKPSEWNQDNAFYWRTVMRGSEVTPEAEEFAVSYYERNELDRAEAAFRLLGGAFPGYAEGENYLGLIALRREKLALAAKHFERTVELGRKLFPAKLPKKHYWSDDRTRPYMRGLRNLALTLVRLGRFDEATAVTNRLEGECGDEVTANSHRAAISLNTRRWKSASDAAMHLHLLIPSESFIAAFALYEQGARAESIALFLHGALNHPRAARMLAGVRSKTAPKGSASADHNLGVETVLALPVYLKDRGRGSTRFFRMILEDPRVAQLVVEIEDVSARWFGHPKADRKLFDRLNEMHDADFARVQARTLFPSIAPAKRNLATMH